MVPVGDDPVLQRGRQILSKPGGHGTHRGAVRLERVQNHEVDVRVVERVVRLGSRGDPAGLGVAR